MVLFFPFFLSFFLRVRVFFDYYYYYSWHPSK